MQYLRILLSIFEKGDFLKSCKKETKFLHFYHNQSSAKMSDYISNKLQWPRLRQSSMKHHLLLVAKKTSKKWISCHNFMTIVGERHQYLGGTIQEHD